MRLAVSRADQQIRSRVWLVIKHKRYSRLCNSRLNYLDKPLSRLQARHKRGLSLLFLLSFFSSDIRIYVISFHASRAASQFISSSESNKLVRLTKERVKPRRILITRPAFEELCIATLRLILPGFSFIIKLIINVKI